VTMSTMRQPSCGRRSPLVLRPDRVVLLTGPPRTR
jgi:hypothetical protein